MKIKKILCMALASSMIFAMPVLAAEDAEAETVFSLTDAEANAILLNDLLETNDVVDTDDFVPLAAFGDRFNIELNADNVMPLATGDQYEPNNSPTTATTGLRGRKVSATLHEGDVDWYQFEVTDTTDPYSFILTNIPAGCDYDLYLINSDITGGYNAIQEGNTTEEFYVYINQPGTYYVVVQSYSGYSDSPYTLYFGPAYKTGSTGWRDPKLSFYFGTVPRGSAAKYVPPQYFNLTNDTTIPDAAVLTDLMITADGNSSDWAGFYKYIAEPSGYGMSQIGNLPTFVVPDMAYYVKQNWSIWGSIQYCTYFIWEPQIFMGYKFVVTPQTLRFVN